MKNTQRSRPESFALAPRPELEAWAHPRCFARRAPGAIEKCGELAGYAIAGPLSLDSAYYCARHAPEGSIALPPVYFVRRVRLELVVYVAGTSMHQTDAQAEAVSRLEELVSPLGGWLDIAAVSSEIVAYGRPLPYAARARRGGDR